MGNGILKERGAEIATNKTCGTCDYFRTCGTGVHPNRLACMEYKNDREAARRLNVPSIPEWKITPMVSRLPSRRSDKKYNMGKKGGRG